MPIGPARPLSVAVVSLALAATACGSRSLGSDADGAVPGDSGAADALAGDARTSDPCEAMDARSDPSLLCDDPVPIGWSWDGAECVPLFCACVGADCEARYPTAAACYAARAPSCLPDPECLGLDIPECEDDPRCGLVWYGGGCIDLDTCEPGGPPEGNWICWEQGFACLPATAPCSDRGRAECDGDCYWWERRHGGCFTEGQGQCCVEESYGYCAPVPGSVGPAGCAAQQVYGCPDACVNVVGYFWDGTACAPIYCCCEGPDCGATYATVEACAAAHAHCSDNACVQAGGYCEYGDYVPPSCPEGYGQFGLVEAEHPGVCELGVCCTPCPEPGPAVSYVSRDPGECAAMDWDCVDPNWISFENECGCGCRLQ